MKLTMNLEVDDVFEVMDNQTRSILDSIGLNSSNEATTMAVDKELVLPIDMRFNDGHKLSIIVYRLVDNFFVYYKSSFYHENTIVGLVNVQTNRKHYNILSISFFFLI